MFHLTHAAAAQILRAAATQPEHTGTPCLRVAAKIEGSEIVYGMGFDTVREHDKVLDSEGVTLLIAPPSQALLDGATLDFVELKPGEFQFIFINPNDVSGDPDCAAGCGTCGNNSAGECN